MSIARAMFSGLTGLNASSQTIGVAGNNIANVNTTSFKRSQAHFETQVSQTLKNGSAPSQGLGGTNPAQIGLGTRLAAITRDFSDGGLQPTGVATHAAIEGSGFFVVEKGGAQRFTRDGTFQLDRDFNLVTNNGGRVQGYGVDSTFNVIEGLLQDINIPLGVLTIAQATRNVNMGGNLNTAGDVATLGSIIESQPMYSDAAATTPATAATALTSVFNALGGAAFPAGAVLTVDEVTRGGAELPARTFEVGASNTTGSDGFGTTLGDFTAFLEDILGIDTAQPGTPGVSINASGQVVVESNTGTANQILIDPGNIIANTGPGANSQPFNLPWDLAQEANGESIRTNFIAYDSLGNPMSIDLTVVQEDQNSTGTEWRFYIHSDDDTDLNKFISTGTLQFDTNGQFVLAQGNSFVIDRTDTGSLDPQTITLQFTDPNGTLGSLTALSGQNTQVNSLRQDGTAIGTLEDFSIAEDGTITGVFSNSLLRDLGRIPLAMFSNEAGLQEVGGNLYTNTSNSGTPQIVNAGTGGSGRTIGRALELSNVDLAQEFISLISAQTGFSANSRIISTSDQMIQELLATIR